MRCNLRLQINARNKNFIINVNIDVNPDRKDINLINKIRSISLDIYLNKSVSLF